MVVWKGVFFPLLFSPFRMEIHGYVLMRIRSGWLNAPPFSDHPFAAVRCLAWAGGGGLHEHSDMRSPSGRHHHCLTFIGVGLTLVVSVSKSIDILPPPPQKVAPSLPSRCACDEG